MPDVLQIDRLTAGYGEAIVLNQVSLALPEGQSLALLGRNGMGKTTLISSIVGVTRFVGGEIRLDGRDITGLRPDQRAHAGIGWVPQERNIFKSLTVEEIVEILGRFHLTVVMYERTGNLPYGKQRLLEIALAIACRPHVLLLDEPAAGVPEDERHEILATVAALPADVTVLLIEHDMDIVFSFADRISVLVNGALFVDGAPDEVARDPRVKAVYLGESLDA